MPNRVAHAVRYSGLRQTASPRFWLPREVRLCAPFFAPDQEIRSGYDPSLYADASSINVRADQTVELLAIEWFNFICRWERKRAATVPNTPLGYGDTDVRRQQAGQNCSTEPDAGQVQGSARMASEDHYCIDILHQIRAAKAALKARFFAITRQIRCCCHEVWR